MTTQASPASVTIAFDAPLPAPTTSRDPPYIPRSRATSLSASRLSARSGSTSSAHNASAPAATPLDAEDIVSTSTTTRGPAASGTWAAPCSDNAAGGSLVESLTRKKAEKGKGKAVEGPSTTMDSAIPSPVLANTLPPQPDPLSSYCCPICFSPPANATLTPCGHICCGSCLFTAIRTTVQRSQMLGEDTPARCPVCRAPIPGWDAKGGGVIGLKTRAVFTL